MTKIKLKSNGTRYINPLTVVKPEFKNSSIIDACIQPGEFVYQDKIGHVQQFDVIVTKRLSSDLVRLFTYHFHSKKEALHFLKSLYKDTSSDLLEQPENISLATPYSKTKNQFEGEAEGSDNTLDQDTDQTETELETTQETEKIKKTEPVFSFNADETIALNNEMHRLLKQPVKTRESGTDKITFEPIGKGIL